MGSCQCHHSVVSKTVKYDIRKRHEKIDPFVPLPSSRMSVNAFDTLKSQSSYGHETFRSSRVSPRADNEIVADPESSHVTNVTSDSRTNHGDSDYEMTSDKSAINSELTDLDSDFGSECLSTTNSSNRSCKQHKHVRIVNVRNAADISSVQEQDDAFMDESLESGDMDPELGVLESSQGSGFFGTISERPYLHSRLGQRQTSHTSEDSREILQWKKGNRLGRGTFGTVWLGMTVTGELIAVKQIELIESDPKEVEKEYAKIYEEVTLLKEMKHRNIVRYLGSSYERSVNHIISVFTEFVPGGSLASIIQKFGALEEPITARYTRQILDAVAYLHSNEIVHRDIKSANIMLMPDGVIKLIDFGCAKKLEFRMSRSGSHLQKSLRGTPYWMAPEVINETGHGKKSDIWSVGCTVFELLTGKPPWADREPLAAIYAIGSDEFPVPLLPDTFSYEAREFVQLALIRDKQKRPAATKLLTHHFLKRPTSHGSVSNKRWGHRRKDTV